MSVQRAPHTEYAPLAILELWSALDLALPGQLDLGGIVGDQAHVYGYHRARAVLPADDYSVVLPHDRIGPPWAAAALDVTPKSAALMPVLTGRLQRAVNRRDRRVCHLREFFGTLDGRNVYGWDLHAGQPSSSDSSHLWHLHLSVHRHVVAQRGVLLPLADLLAGR